MEARVEQIKTAILQYWKSNKILWIGQAISIFIFAVIISLYDVPADAWQYAALLIVVSLMALTTYDFLRFFRKHQKLTEASRQILFRSNALEEPKYGIEKDYMRIIRIQAEEIQRIVTESDLTKTDMLDYYSMWVHQIKTPISAMHLMLQTNKTTESGALRLELFKIEQYVEMALNYLRLGSDSTDFVIKPYKISEIIKNAIKKYKGIFIEKNITLKFEEMDFVTITDEKWLSFAIEQILSNALKYTTTGSITIYMEGDTLAIRDTGCGIIKEDLPRVFEKGFTGYNGRMDKKSTGIGLYLSKRILNKLSHDIAISSEPGEGTVLRIRFEPYNDVRLDREM
ncbi:MAG: sensor histidine kinase [Clostridiales bacterium]|nr:sensor histidine kinase [Clostridiales bacterium]